MNFVIESMTYAWLVIAVLFLMLEVGSPGLFFFLSFFCGGVCAAGASLCISSIIIQISIFFIATILALLMLRYGVLPFIEKNRPHERTNVYALQGKRGFATMVMNEKQSGMVKINGSVWAARSVHGIINVQDEVEVIDVRGTHVIVKKIM